jgi:hypothetical protein
MFVSLTGCHRSEPTTYIEYTAKTFRQAINRAGIGAGTGGCGALPTSDILQMDIIKKNFHAALNEVMKAAALYL